METLIGPDTEVFDLGGRTAIPGIVDSHCHPDSFAIKLLKLHLLDPETVPTLDALLALIDRATRDSPLDDWFVGYGCHATRGTSGLHRVECMFWWL